MASEAPFLRSSGVCFAKLNENLNEKDHVRVELPTNRRSRVVIQSPRIGGDVSM